MTPEIVGPGSRLGLEVWEEYGFDELHPLLYGAEAAIGGN